MPDRYTSFAGETRAVGRRSGLHGTSPCNTDSSSFGFEARPMTIPLRPLGRTELRVSEIGFGGVEIGLEYGIQVRSQTNLPDPRVATRIVQRAIEMGVNVIDTARGYGASERLIGDASATMRDQLVLMTKVSCPGKDTHGRALRDLINNSLETSLAELQTSYVDVLSVHSASAHILSRGEVVDCVDRLRAAGKVRYVGATVYTAQEALAALQDPRIHVLQIAYSLLDPSMADQIIPLAAQRGVGIIARSVLHRGVLTGKGAQGSADERRLYAHACNYDFLFDDQTTTLPQVAVRFVLSNEGVSCALLGMDTLCQVEENLAALPQFPYPDADILRATDQCPSDPWSILPGHSST